jgi:hypothetical protein
MITIRSNNTNYSVFKDNFGFIGKIKFISITNNSYWWFDCEFNILSDSEKKYLTNYINKLN